MCWACHERETSSYRACDGCNELKELDQLQKYDIFKRWGELAEFVNQKRIVVFCSACTEEMDKYRDYIIEQKPRTEIMIPENGMPVARYVYPSQCTPVGIHVFAQQKTIGIRCAKIVYGCDITEEILQGYIYWDSQGHQIRRLTTEDIDGTVRCDKCWLRLCDCNAMEAHR